MLYLESCEEFRLRELDQHRHAGYAWTAPAHILWDLYLMHDDLSGNQYRYGIPVQWEIQTPSRIHGRVRTSKGHR